MKTADEIEAALLSYQFNAGNEADLQDGVHAVLKAEGAVVDREVRLGPQDRVDFMVGGIAIELKVKHTLAQVLRQLERYAEHARVTELMLVTTKSGHLHIGTSVGGKPLRVVWLRRGL